MLQWSPDLEDPGVRTPRRLPFPSASDRVEMSQEYGPSVRSKAADPSPATMQSPSAPSGDGDAGPRDREPSPGSSEETEAAMFDRITEYIEEVRTSLQIDVSDHLYTRCMAELRSLREGRFDRVTQSLENFRALIDELHSRLVLVEDSRFASPEPTGQGRPERPTSPRRPEERASPSVEQLGAFAHLSAELDATLRRSRDMERTVAERLPGAPSRGPGGAVPPVAAAPQGWRPTGVYPSRGAEDRRPPMGANVASETRALPPAPGSRWQTGREPHRDDLDRGGAARESGEPMLPVYPRWGGYPPANYAEHPGPVDVHTLPVTPFETLGPAEPELEPVHTMI